LSTGRGAGRLSDEPGEHDLYVWFAFVGAISTKDGGLRIARSAARPTPSKWRS
jgi:hypothetical protein